MTYGIDRERVTFMAKRSSRILGSVIGAAASVGALASRVAAVDPSAVRPMAAAHAQAQGSQTGAPAVSPERALVNRYCVTCHNEQRKTPAGAPLMLDKVDVDRVELNPAVWEKVTRKVRSGAMPPAGMPRPDAATFMKWVTAVEGTLDAAATANPNPGRPAAVHRLNRAEYTNAIRDLLALEVDGRELLPPDDAGYGFDNIGDVLSVSPGLMERYMLAASKISRQVIGDPTLGVATTTYKTSPYVMQDDRANEDLPFGSRGGLAVRHHFPLDGEYVVKVSLKGPADQQQVEVRLDRALVKLFDLSKPGANRGLEIRVSIKAGTRLVGAAFVSALDRSLPIDGRPSSVPITSFEFSQSAIGSIQITGPYNGEVPEETAGRQKVFVCRPASRAEEKGCAGQILSTVAGRAYRRPVTEAEVAPLVATYERGRETGTFETGIQWGLEAILVAPKFLFRVEGEPAGAVAGRAYRLSDVELASRLSFFLWSSLPDEELGGLAARGRLHEPGVLAGQVARLLRDARAQALVTNFGGQWLYLRNVRLAAPNAAIFPGFDDNLREALQRETELFLADQVGGDHPLRELLTANYTFVNQRLAEHYGIGHVYGSHFRKVTLPDERRAGLLGQGSILLVTSEPNRTSPVKRGKWLLENLLGAPPPPPPPNVPALKENGEGGQATTVRERMEQHRKNPVCASCHAQMDPLGFAMENFDAIGRWRTEDEEAHTPIDASGTLMDGSHFSGPAEFRGLLLKRQEDFARTVVEKLLTYALGRGLEYYDAPVVRQILREAAPRDYRWSAIIGGIVQSVPFQMRVAGRGATATTQAN